MAIRESYAANQNAVGLVAQMMKEQMRENNITVERLIGAFAKKFEIGYDGAINCVHNIRRGHIFGTSSLAGLEKNLELWRGRLQFVLGYLGFEAGHPIYRQMELIDPGFDYRYNRVCAGTELEDKVAPEQVTELPFGFKDRAFDILYKATAIPPLTRTNHRHSFIPPKMPELPGLRPDPTMPKQFVPDGVGHGAVLDGAIYFQEDWVANPAFGLLKVVSSQASAVLEAILHGDLPNRYPYTFQAKDTSGVTRKFAARISL